MARELATMLIDKYMLLRARFRRCFLDSLERQFSLDLERVLVLRDVSPSLILYLILMHPFRQS